MQAGRLQETFEMYGKKADFYIVYIREAHPSDGFRPSKRVDIEQPTTFDRRDEVAQTCVKALKLKIPALVDDMKDSVAKAYNAMPDRLFVLAADGTIAYRGDRGPRGFKVDEMAEALSKALNPPTK